ncbi:MAG: hypothetical protein IJS39_17950 [Synergistaceae bacterium]|nr:hypothetical protein [Synergistaceae bacterium]
MGLLDFVRNIDERARRDAVAKAAKAYEALRDALIEELKTHPEEFESELVATTSEGEFICSVKRREK